jgi:hypothetical protein
LSESDLVQTKDLPLESRIVLKSLSEKYARRAREFSDTVALLGQHNEVTPEFVQLFREIKQQRALCRDAEEKFERHLQHELDNAKAAAAA